MEVAGSQFMSAVGYINLDVNNYKLSLVQFNNNSDKQQYLCLYNGDKYKGLCSNADEIYNVFRSSDSNWFAYMQYNINSKTIDLILYGVNMNDLSFDVRSCISLDAELCNDEQHYVLFSPDNKYVVFKCEWNHIYIINLITNERTEFFIPNTRANMMPQLLYMCADNYLVWFGYDEHVRIIDLNPKHPVMWLDKMIYTIRDYHLSTKYFGPLPGNYLLFMDKYNKTTILKVNKEKKQFEFVYDIAYPAIGYDDLYIDNDTICFTSEQYKCIVNLVDKSCRVTKSR